MGGGEQCWPLRGHPPACRAGAEGEGEMSNSDPSAASTAAHINFDAPATFRKWPSLNGQRRVDSIGPYLLLEADYEATDLETVIEDLLSGQYNNPIRVVAFNTEERWSEDVSEDVAQELRRRCDLEARDVPSSIQDFVERHEGYVWRQLTLRLV